MVRNSLSSLKRLATHHGVLYLEKAPERKEVPNVTAYIHCIAAV
jgi:hypothetical protein